MWNCHRWKLKCSLRCRPLIRQPHGRLHPPSHAVQSCYLPLQHPRPARPRRLLPRRRGKHQPRLATDGHKRAADFNWKQLVCLKAAIISHMVNMICPSSWRSCHKVWQLIIYILRTYQLDFHYYYDHCFYCNVWSSSAFQIGHLFSSLCFIY